MHLRRIGPANAYAVRKSAFTLYSFFLVIKLGRFPLDYRRKCFRKVLFLYSVTENHWKK